MTHFICKNGTCASVSERPSVCMEASCPEKYKLLEECFCPHRSRHLMKTNSNYIHTKNSYVIDSINFGIALGGVLGIVVFFLGIVSMFGWGTQAVTVLSSLYVGYDSTMLGAIAGGLWGLVYGFVAGIFIAWFYNQLSRVR